MPVPIPLGVNGFCGEARDYVPFGGGGLAGPFAITTTVDIPASTLVDPVSALIVIAWAPFNNFFDHANFPIFTITDDVPASTNSWLLNGVDGIGAYAYGFGRPTFQCPASFDIRIFGTVFDGGSLMTSYVCAPSTFMPAGTVINLSPTFPPPPTPTSNYGHATLIVYQDAAYPAGPQLSSRSFAPQVTDDGNSANEPLGDHLLNEIFGTSDAACAFCWSDDCVLNDTLDGCSGDPIDGTQTITDTSGQWVSVNTDGAASTSFFGGIVLNAFTMDCSTADLTQPIVTFDIDNPSFPLLDLPTGVVVFRFVGAGGVVPPTSFPVFAHMFRAA